TKSSSTSLNSLLEETHNFDNSLPEFTTFSNVLCDVEYESNSSDDQLCSDEDVLKKIVSKPLSEEEIIPMKSLRTHDSSLPISSKIDSLLEEFDSDSLMEEIDLFCTLDYPMPSGIVDEDYDSERDILIPKDFPSNNTLSFAEKESFHFDIPPFSRPSAKPPDGDTGILNIKMMGDISDQKDFMHKLMITLALHQEKSPDLLSHRLKKTQKKDKIGSKPDKNGKRGEAEKSQKQLQWIEEEKLKKTEKEGSEMRTQAKTIKVLKEERRKRG
nr:hypothetical protein [Tanacetum cinerariifolium]